MKTQSNYGISYPLVLFFIFLVLKLCKVITWSWWWVTAPIWGEVLIVIVTVLLLEFKHSHIEKEIKNMTISTRPIQEAAERAKEMQQRYRDSLKEATPKKTQKED